MSVSISEKTNTLPVNIQGRKFHPDGADPPKEIIGLFCDEYENHNRPKSLEFVADDVSGTMITVVGSNGRDIAVTTNSKNELVIDGKTYREVDDDKLKFEVVNDKLLVLRDGKALEGYTPIELQENAFLLRKLDDVTKNAKLGSFRELYETVVESIKTPSLMPALSATPSAVNKVAEDSRNQEMSFSGFLSRGLEDKSNGLEKQKFQYGGYDSSTVTTVNTWSDVLKSGAVKENSDGSVTLTTSGDRPRVQFYPDDRVAGGRHTTRIEDLKDVSFDFSIDHWNKGDAAWIYELHKVGDGQAMAIGFNQEGKLMLANGDTNETEISMVDAGRIAIDYVGNNANISIYNKDGSLRGDASIKVSGEEVHVKGIEVYNRRAAAYTEASVTFGRIAFGA